MLLPVVLTFILAAVAVVLAAGSACMNAYSQWALRVKIPAIRAGVAPPPPSMMVRLGARLAGVSL